MAVCISNKVDSNISSLSIAEEECLKHLPDTVPDSGDEGAAVWYGQPVNSYSDFGGDFTKKARAPISASRQNQKGAVVDLDASGGWNMDVLAGNMTRPLQGFFFADAREPDSTQPLNAPKVAITAVDGATKTYSAAAGLATFVAGQLLFMSGFANAANNGLKTVASSTATTVVVVEPTVTEATPPAAAMFQRVGGQLTAGDVSIAVVGGIPSLVSTATDFTTFPGFFPGKWIFLGGDAAANRFANNVGYARVASVTANAMTFDDTTFVPVNEAGTGKSIRFFVGVTIKNESDPALIKRRSYNLERTLGPGTTGTQAEYLIGAVANEFTLNVALADILTADLAYVACDDIFRSGEVGDAQKTGVRVPAMSGDAFNTSSDMYRIKLAVHDDDSSSPDALFGYASEATIAINNNVAPSKAIGVLGAFDTSAGNFDVSGTMTVFFTTVSAVKAIRNNADVGYSVIAARQNTGFIYDIPMLGLGGGRLTVEKDTPIMIPLETAGSENKYGFTMSYTSFAYLPNVAMPK